MSISSLKEKWKSHGKENKNKIENKIKKESFIELNSIDLMKPP